MRIAVILNGISRKKNHYLTKIHPVIADEFDVTVYTTEFAGHAITLATSLCAEYDCLLAAGGDGTLNQLVNGVMRAAIKSLNRPMVGVIPLGTGNDFARTCGISNSGDELLQLLRKNSPKPTDIGLIQCHDDRQMKTTNYFINVCSLGMGPAVVKRIEGSSRRWGPDITYISAILTTFLRQRSQMVTASSSNWELSIPMRVLAVANGKTFGHAICLDPDARPDDGIFSVFVSGDLSWLKFIQCLLGAKAGKKLSMNGVHYYTTTAVELTSSEPCALEAEGELKGWLPARIEVAGERIDFLR